MRLLAAVLLAAALGAGGVVGSPLDAVRAPRAGDMLSAVARDPPDLDRCSYCPLHVLTIAIPGYPEAVQGLAAAGIPPCDPTPNTYLCHTAVTPTVFQSSSTAFTGFSSIFIGAGFGTDSSDGTTVDALEARAGDIEAYVRGGAGLVVLTRDGATLDWIPRNGLNNFASDTSLTGNTVVVTPAGQTHPALAGVDSNSLSNWNNSYHSVLDNEPDSWDLLATEGNGSPVTVAGEVDGGCIFVSTQDADGHAVLGSTGAQQLLRSSLLWTSSRKGVDMTTQEPICAT